MHLRVEADSERLARTVTAAFGLFAQPQSVTDAFILRLQYGQPVLAAGGWRIFHEGTMPGGMFCRSWAGHDRWAVEVPGQALLEVHTSSRRAEVTVQAGCEWAAGQSCVIPAVCGFLADAGQHVLHAACLSLDREAGSPAILMAGQSGMGKSTTALAMSRNGFGLLSDDTCFLLTQPDGRLGAWGLPRACKVHTHTMELLPWLKDCRCRPAATAGESFIDINELAVADSHAVHTPAAVLLLERRNDHSHRLWPADGVSALARLTRENVRAVDDKATGAAGQAFRLLGRLLASCPAYHLSVGPDLATVASHIAEHLWQEK